MLSTDRAGTVQTGRGQLAVSPEEDPAQDHYVQYLAQVNETSAVYATEDICNNRGVLLVKSGSCIDQSVAARVLQHKLLKPLEDQVKLQDQIDGDRLAGHFATLAGRYPDIAQINQALGFEEEFRRLLHFPAVSQPLCQKLTVFQARLPESFEAGLFGGWLGALLARELHFDKKGIRCAMLAGLARDLGFLHIDPRIVYKKGALDAAEWRAIMSHVVVAKLFLSRLTCVSGEVVQAVLEHHERYDGTGYPAGHHGEQLSLLGNITGLVDTLQALRMKQFEPRGRNLMDARPYLQLNVNKHSEPVYRAMMQLLQKSGLSMTRVRGEELAVLAARLQDRLVMLQKVIPQLQRLTSLPAEPPAWGRQGRAAARVATNVLEMIQSSGLDRDELIDWARRVENEPTDRHIDEIIETELLANELMWQLNSVHRACLNYCTGQSPDTPPAASVREACEVLGRLLKAAR